MFLKGDTSPLANKIVFGKVMTKAYDCEKFGAVLGMKLEY
jgi:hypothetical protein